MNRKKTLPPLSRLEQDVMDTVWRLTEQPGAKRNGADSQSCTSSEVVDAFQQKRALAPTTIRTVLANLRKKGYITPVPTIERGFRLRPAVAREVEARRSLNDVVSRFFAGSTRQAISCLLGEERISKEELAEIRRALDQMDR